MKNFLNKESKHITLKDLLVVFSGFTLILLLTYGSTINNGYSLDDEFIYTENPIAIRGLSNITDIFTKTSFDYKNTSFGYRPITILSFALENEFFGVNSKASHSINLLLYLLAAFFLFRSMVLLFPNKQSYLPLLTGFLFLILPIHSEIANNIKCRDELLMLLFGLLAMYYWIKANDKKYYLIPSILLLVLSILSKKSGLVFLGILPMITFFSSQGDWKKTLKFSLFMIVPAIFFRMVTKSLKEGKGDRVYNFVENPLFHPTAMVNKTVIILESFWFYIKSMLLPLQFVSYYGYDTIPINGFHLTSVCAVVVFVFLVYLALKGLKSQKAYAFGAILLLGALLPFLHLFQPMVGIVAERFTTLASLGFCILLVYGVVELMNNLNQEKRIRSLTILLFIYWLAYLPAMKARNKEWDSNISLLEADTKKEPKSALLSGALVSHYLAKATQLSSEKEKQRLGKKGLALCAQSLAVYPLEKVYMDQASIHFKIFRDYKNAENSLLKALALHPKSRDVLNNISLLYKELGDKENTIKYFKKLLAEYPKEIQGYSVLAQLLATTGKGAEAITILNQGLTSNGNEYTLVLSMANVYNSMGELENALEWYKKAFKIKPQEMVLKQRIDFLSNQLKKAE